jgi:hypothetical protein
MTWGDLMTGAKKLCVLTVHGIGFQQPPTDSAAGYADVLHENLSDGLSPSASTLTCSPGETTLTGSRLTITGTTKNNSLPS